MLEDEEWRGKPDIVAFAELYNFNFIFYDAMTCSIPYVTAENERANHTVYILIINPSHFNTLNIKIV